MVRIRMKRFGKKNRPFYRIGVFDARTRRDGRPVEEIGSYDPFAENASAGVQLDLERARHWLSVGAQPTEKVQALLRQAGLPWPPAKKPRRKKKPAASRARSPKA